MRATPGGKPFTSPDWVYEIKFDGYRCMALFGGARAPELRTKNGTDCTKWYPEIASALSAVPGGPHVVDAEACVIDDMGRSNFERLQARARRRRWTPGSDAVTLCAFDLLIEDGRSLMGLPLEVRKARLEALLGRLAGALVVKDLPCDTRLFAEVVERLELEGFVAKRKSSLYLPGVVSPDWMKIKRKGWSEGRTWRP